MYETRQAYGIERVLSVAALAGLLATAGCASYRVYSGESSAPAAEARGPLPESGVHSGPSMGTAASSAQPDELMRAPCRYQFGGPMVGETGLRYEPNRRSR